MFAYITLNSPLALSTRIHEVTKIEVAEDRTINTLLAHYCEDIETYDLFLGMDVWNEAVRITLEGID